MTLQFSRTLPLPAIPTEKPGDGKTDGTRRDIRPAPAPMERPRPRKPRSPLIYAAGAAVLGLCLLGFIGERYMIPRSAPSVTVTAGAFQPEISGPGVLDATDMANVGSSVQGVISRLTVDRNSTVMAGDLVAEITAGDLEAQRNAAAASQQAAEKATEARAADLSRSESVLDNARRTLTRQTALLRSGVSTQASFEAAEASLRQAEADRAGALSALRQAEAQAISARASAAAAQAAFEKSIIHAPISGIVIARSLNLGDVVTPTSPIITIADPQSIVLSARFDEGVIADIAAGQRAMVGFGNTDAAQFPGTVRRVSREVDQETREFTVDIALQRLPPNWAIGQRGRVTVALAARSGVLSVPAPAIVRRDGHAGVWVVENGRARWRAIDTGAIGKGWIEVVRGLADGEAVLLHPANVYERMPVASQEGRS